MDDDPLGNCYAIQKACDWHGIYGFYQRCFDDSGQWIFRGHSDPTWLLKSTIDRQFSQYGIMNADRIKVEQGVVRRFKRECHRYLDHPPEPESDLEWIALMRHYGAPCRVVDWTYSFFVALFFAVEGAVSIGGNFWCAVLCFDAEWLKITYKGMLEAIQEPGLLERYKRGGEAYSWLKLEYIRTFLLHNTRPVKIVAGISPFRLNERLGIQQSLFLCPGDIREDFDHNFAYMLQHCDGDPRQHFVKLELTMTLEERKNILRRLQSMNMNRATLYPGLQGFAESLNTLMADAEHYLAAGEEDEDHR